MNEVINMKKCPFCGSDMISGYLYAPRSSAVYWLPEGITLLRGIVSSNNVEESGGVVLGSATRIGFFARKRAKSYYCKLCKILITSVED